MRPLPEYPLSQHTFSTPRGQSVSMWVRGNTNDWNTCNSALTEDEYGLRELNLTGRALDVGAHIGSVAIGLALDNLELEVIALEAVPPNIELLRLNLALNGLTERVQVIEGAACGPKRKTQAITYGYRGNDLNEHHAFIGNSTLAPTGIEKETIRSVCHSLSEFTPLDFIKIDCEGCEWDFLQGPELARVERIHGEWHPVLTHRQSDVVGLLGDTHDVTFSGPVEGPGGFRAVRK